jgi:diguanylate cyclase (GGDEF)-like protein
MGGLPLLFPESMFQECELKPSCNCRRAFGSSLLKGALLVPFASLFSRQARSEPTAEIPAPRADRTMKSHVLEAGADVLQAKKPIDAMSVYLNGFHFYADDMGRQVEANHFCTHLNEDFHQCVIYDSNQSDARLIGIEYIVSERIFASLPADEKRLWHSHKGILERAGRRLPWGAYGTYGSLILALLWYFFYIERNLLVRVYVLNVGFGLLFCFAALRIRSACTGRRIDTLLFVVLLLFGLHFLPRTVLSLGAQSPQGPLAFADSAFWQLLQLSLAIFSVSLAIILLVAIAADAIEEVRHEGDKDWLTGVYNRRGFEARARAHYRDSRASAVLIICDVDHFKRINDAHGHHGGDVVLQKVARILNQSLRSGDVLGRIGGEEFAIFLPATDHRVAVQCAEGARVAIADSVHGPDTATPVTISLGLAQTKSDEAWESLFRRADEKLYQAKRAGRNQVAS